MNEDIKMIKEVDCTHLALPPHKYTVAIIGCGSIGALKDDRYDRPGGDAILTHAHAFHAHPQTELVACVDPDTNKLQSAYNKWNFRYGGNDVLGKAMRDSKPDIIIVATPTETHERVLLDLLKLDPLPKLVVAEKPFCSTLTQASWVKSQYDAAGIPILVDYIRRFDFLTMDVLSQIRNGAYGKIFHARCLYGRGIKRDGCHAIDLLNYVFGQSIGMLIHHDTAIDDGEPGDKTYDIRLNYERCPDVQMVGVDSRKYGLFELEFITAKGIIHFHDWGKYINIYPPDEEETFGQYKSLSRKSHLCKKLGTSLNTAMLHMADNCVRYLSDGERLLCTAEDAIRVHRILENVKGEL